MVGGCSFSPLSLSLEADMVCVVFEIRVSLVSEMCEDEFHYFCNGDF